MNPLNWLGGILGRLAIKLFSIDTFMKRTDLFGIDISKHNGVIDWKKVALNVPKVDFAFIKASEGQDFIDIRFVRNAEAAKKAGIKIGYYHFASLNTKDYISDAREEARDFVSTMKLAPKADLPPVLDLETNKAMLNRDIVLSWIKFFLDEMKKLGYPDVIIYSYTPFLDENLPKNHGLGDNKLWIAGYVPARRMRIPVGWNKYWAWQFSSEGKVQGISTNTDLNTTGLLQELIKERFNE